MAIAFDAATSASPSASFTHTLGANATIVWAFWGGAHGSVPAGGPPYAKCGGQTMTPAGQANTLGMDISGFYLVNPPVGAQTVTFYGYDGSQHPNGSCFAVSYNGVKSVGASNWTSLFYNQTSVSLAVTTDEIEDWIVGYGGAGYGTSFDVTAGTHTSFRRSNSPGDYPHWFMDSNGKFDSIGSNSLQMLISPATLTWGAYAYAQAMHALPIPASALDPLFVDF